MRIKDQEGFVSLRDGYLKKIIARHLCHQLIKMNIVYLNGQFLPIEHAKISVLDRGFLFGDGVYETIPVHSGQPFRLQEHLVRLNESLKAIQLHIKMSDWEAIFQELLQRNHIQNGQDAKIYLQITRGPELERKHQLPQKNLEASIFIKLSPLQKMTEKKLAQGFKLISLRDTRWAHCHIKTTSLLPNVLLVQEAKKQGAEDTLLIRDGHVIEGATSNIFIVKNGKVFTPPESPYMLTGITRTLIIELAKAHQLPLHIQNFTLKEVYDADEVWISSSSRDVMPITQVDDHMIRNGKSGPYWEKMLRWIRTYQ